VAQQVFDGVLHRKKGLLANSTVLFVTNQLKWLKYADKILVIGDGDDIEEITMNRSSRKEHKDDNNDDDNDNEEDDLDGKQRDEGISDHELQCKKKCGKVIGFGSLAELQIEGIDLMKLKDTIKSAASASAASSSLPPEPPSSPLQLIDEMEGIIKVTTTVNNNINNNNINNDDMKTLAIEEESVEKAVEEKKKKKVTSFTTFDDKSIGSVQGKVYFAFLSR
jgi:hypothetical protein